MVPPPQHDALDDEALFARYAAGEAQAFQTLFARFAPLLTRVVRRRVFDAAQAQDLVQQTFLQVHRARFDFRVDGRLRPWVITICMNVVRQHFRRTRRAAELPLEEDGSWLPTVAPHDPVRAEAARQLHVALAQLPDGTIAWQQFDVREGTDPSTGETESLVGDAIAELSPDGTVRTVFSAWDWVDVAHNRFMDLPSLYPQGVDWTHGNALKYLPEQDGYLLSLGNAGVVLQVDRTTDTPWQIVGNAGVPVADDSNPLEHQHDPTWLSDDRLLVFDSHFSTYSSGAVEYALQDGALHEVWRHGFQDGSFALLLGQALRQDDGSTLVNYGSAGVLEQVDADDRVQWRVELPAQTGFAQVRVLGSWGEGAFPGW